MTRRRVILIILAVISLIVIIVIVSLNFRKVTPAETGSVTANQQQGVTQTDDSETEEQPGVAGSTEGQADQNQNQPTPPAKRSDPEILDAIIKQKSSLIGSDNQPVFTITNTKRTQNAWYVVTVRHKNPTVGTAKIILRDNGGSAGLVVIAGPGTYFDPADIYLPDEVRALL